MAREQSIEEAAQTPTQLRASDDVGKAPHRNPRFELRCLGCGYGAISAELIRCPMCGDEAWDFAEWRPFSQ
jgi:rubrerythrin